MYNDLVRIKKMFAKEAENRALRNKSAGSSTVDEAEVAPFSTRVASYAVK